MKKTVSLSIEQVLELIPEKGVVLGDYTIQNVVYDSSTGLVHVDVDVWEDWTRDPETGRSNSSPQYNAVVADVNHTIKEQIPGACDSFSYPIARLIVSRLAHRLHMSPPLQSEEKV